MSRPIASRARLGSPLALRAASLMLAGLLACACDPPSSSGTSPLTTPSSSASSSAGSTVAGSQGVRIGQIRHAEWARQPTKIKPADLTSRDVTIRRLAIRALARIRGPVARDALLNALHDPDLEVKAWAAYGLGDDCKPERDQVEKALITTFALLKPNDTSGASARTADALIRAVGRCRGPKAEISLIAWAKQRGSHQDSAFRALGDVARGQRQLSQATVVALLALASGNATESARPGAIYPLSQLDFVPLATVARLSEVAAQVLKDALKLHAPVLIQMALKTLGRGNATAVGPLKEQAMNPELSVGARVTAVDALLRHGKSGQKALIAVLQTLSKSVPKIATDSIVFVSVINAIDKPKAVHAALQVFAQAAPGADPDGNIKRRYSHVRCAAAAALSGKNPLLPLLRNCELGIEASPDPLSVVPGAIVATAIVGVIGRNGTKLNATNALLWKRYVAKAPLTAREAALQLLERMSVPGADAVLLEALADAKSGMVATASSVIAKRPALVLGKNATLDDEKPVAKKLVALLDGQVQRDLEAINATIDATKALGLQSAVGPLRKLCRSAHVTVRSHAQAALRKLAKEKTLQCLPPKGGLPALGSLVPSKPVTIKMTIAGRELKLTLDASLAPLATSRFVELVKSGFFTGNTVHRVAPGFVAQFGSPFGDGYGAPKGYAPMACETSPEHFGMHRIGVALAGRDTGTSQFFVTLGDFPHLDGRYAFVGKASGPWHLLVAGDVIEAATTVP